jgi:hypothetical protein
VNWPRTSKMSGKALAADSSRTTEGLGPCELFLPRPSPQLSHVFPALDAKSRPSHPNHLHFEDLSVRTRTAWKVNRRLVMSRHRAEPLVVLATSLATNSERLKLSFERSIGRSEKSIAFHFLHDLWPGSLAPGRSHPSHLSDGLLHSSANNSAGFALNLDEDQDQLFGSF